MTSAPGSTPPDAAPRRTPRPTGVEPTAGPAPDGRTALLKRIAAAVLVVVVLVELVVLVRALRTGDQPPATTRRTPALVVPEDVPPRGALVTSRVRADGRVSVTQWLSSPEVLDQVSVSLPSVEPTEGVRATGVRLVARDGTVLADDLTVDRQPLQVDFGHPTSLVRATYVLTGVSTRSETDPGRVLVRALSLHLDGGSLTGPTVVVVAAPAGGAVRNLACVDARSAVTLAHPCGKPAGSDWQVHLTPSGPTERVEAQVDLDRARGSG